MLQVPADGTRQSHLEGGARLEAEADPSLRATYQAAYDAAALTVAALEADLLVAETELAEWLP